jgi:hypothetical protein
MMMSDNNTLQLIITFDKMYHPEGWNENVRRADNYKVIYKSEEGIANPNFVRDVSLGMYKERVFGPNRYTTMIQWLFEGRDS